MLIAVFLIVITPYTAALPALYMSLKVLSSNFTIHKNPWNIGLFLLFAWSFIVGILNKSLLSTISAVAILLYLGVSIYLQNCFKEENKVEKLIKYLLYFSSLSAVFGIIEKLIFIKSNENILSTILGVASKATLGHRIYSTFGNPNVAGHWFAVMTLLCLYTLGKINSKERKLYIIMIILFVVALCLTGSRGAYVGLLSALPIYYVFSKDKKDSALIGFMVVLLAILIFFPQYTATLSNITGHKLERSMVTRDMIWDGCLEMIKLKPLTGWGILGVFENASNFISYDGPVYHAHNIWINFFTTLGIIGFSIYAYMKYYVFKSLWILYSQNSRLFSLLASIQVLIIGHSIVDVTILTPQTGLIFMCTSAITCSLATQYILNQANNPILDSYKSLSKTG